MGAVYVMVGCEGEVQGLVEIYICIYISACIDRYTCWWNVGVGVWG